MINHKMVKYVFILILITSLGTNYYLYKENTSFLSELGSENQTAVRLTLHELSEGSTDLWIKTLREEHGDVVLERHIGELHQYSRKFHGMSGEMSVIGILIDSLINHYYQLKASVQSGTNIKETSSAINIRIQLLEKLLNQIDSNLGDNQKLWYTELSGFDTKTQSYVLEIFNEFQSQNKEGD
jgi:hypothetical protein